MTRSFTRHYLAGLALLAVALLTGCRNESDTQPLDVPIDLLRNGDLALRCGTSIESEIVIGINGKEGAYSHIGIVIDADGQWFVAHAVPGENERGKPEYVKMDPIAVFYGRDRAKQGCILRVSDDSAACRQATAYALWAIQSGKTFDNNYDWQDTSRLYCTEMVQQAYRHAGIDLAEGRHTRVASAIIGGTYVLPSDIAANDSLRSVCHF